VPFTQVGEPVEISACTVTSSAVVASSAMSTCGSGRDRGGDQDALQHAAGQFVGVLVVDQLGLAQPHRGQQLDRAVPGGFAESPFFTWTTSATANRRSAARVEVGGEAGSWKTALMVAPRRFRPLWTAELSDVAAGQLDPAAGHG